MTMKRPMYNRNFYPGDCARQVEEFISGFEPPEEPPDLFAGVVPHAGWAYSGRVAARVWRTLSERVHPKTVIIFGAVHYPGVDENALYPSGSWETPLGDVPVDEDLAQEILKEMKALVKASVDAHREEHSIEVQLPFVKALLPDAKVLPIAVPPHGHPVQFGDLLAHLVRDRSVAAVGSTDLTHYGEERFSYAPRGTGETAHEWMKENDRRLIRLVEGLQAEEIIPEIAARHNACGPGALSAITAYARARGSEGGHLIEHTTSHEVMPEEPFRFGVGYAGIVL